MLVSELQFHRPATLREALKILEEQEATILAGGMSLVPAINLGLARPETLVSLNGVGELRKLEWKPDKLCIGSMVRHGEIEQSRDIASHFRALSEAASRIGDVQVRNRGTIGGSIAHADPGADYLPVTLALDARFRLVSSRGERVVRAREFFVGPMSTARDSAEILVTIELPRRESWGSAYVRLARAEGAFPIANAAADIGPQGAWVAVGGIGSRPAVAEIPLDIGAKEGEEAVAAAVERGVVAAIAEVDIIEDATSDLEYRRAMAFVCARRAFLTALGRAQRSRSGGKQ